MHAVIVGSRYRHDEALVALCFAKSNAPGIFNLTDGPPMAMEPMQHKLAALVRYPARPDFIPTELETALHQSLQKEWSL